MLLQESTTLENEKPKIYFAMLDEEAVDYCLKLIFELKNSNKVQVLENGFKSISSEIALIPQDPEIFSTTIKENITLGVGHNLNYIKRFTDMAKFTEIVGRLPKGFSSSIVERGVNLSGGEKQRLALARGLMACEDKEIILLDEPTSSVDFKNEFLIYQNIFEKFKKKTVVSSIHRLHLLPLFDRICIFKNGKIIESGSFEELMKKSESFKKMIENYNKTHLW